MGKAGLPEHMLTKVRFLLYAAGCVDRGKPQNPCQPGSRKALEPLGFQGSLVVDGTGLEPVTPCTSSRCSYQLS